MQLLYIASNMEEGRGNKSEIFHKKNDVKVFETVFKAEDQKTIKAG